MPRFGNVMIAYFLMGALVYGGGAIPLSESGIVKVMFHVDEDGVHPSKKVTDEIEGIRGASIQALVNVVGGGLLIIWDIVVLMFGSVFWPMIALNDNGAPIEVTILLGGGMSVAFLEAGLRFFRSSV